MNDNIKSRKIGLALGGGATLGAAHIGVLEELEKASVDVHCISGTSIGAYVAALYAFGISPSDIEKEFRGLDWLDVSSFSWQSIKLGLLSNDKLGDNLKKVLGKVEISDADIPLAVVATDIAKCEKVVLTKGSVSKAVMASTAVPGIFAPVTIDDQMLVDGGLVENVPVSPLKDLGADLIIGVDLSAQRSYRKPDDLIDVLMNSIDLAIDNATRLQTAEADIVISPKLKAYSRTDSGQITDLIDEGRDAARSALKNADIASA